jgi:prepilin-type N-terminal cleavage/methylation domain-containing protein
MNPRIRSHRNSRRGISLLEMAIAVTILAILAAAAVPVTTTVLGYHMRKAKRDELSEISQACGEYFRDTLSFPTSVDQLLRDPNGGRSASATSNPSSAETMRVPGWAGPYLLSSSVDPISKLDAWEVDAWSRSYKISRSGDVLTIASAGDDAIFGSTDDLSIELDVTWIRRDVTLEFLRVINQAIVIYNGQYQMTAPLPANYAGVYSTLVNKGLLPASSGYQADAWGDPFVEDPIGRTPVVRVQSLHVIAGAPASSTGSKDSIGSGNAKR